MASWLRMFIVGLVLPLPCLWPTLSAQEKSVRPEINKNFQNPDAKVWVKKFETESREVWAHRQAIVEACKLRPGMAVADIGAGTGLFTRLLAKAVGSEGQVYAVDIAHSFVEHVKKTSQAEGLKNVIGVVCTQTSAELPPAALDLVFLCDTYHHFEFPTKTMASIHKALKAKGQLILIDFKRIKGVSSEWTMNHVRAGQEVFTQEIKDSGFKLIEEVKGPLKDNYFLRFEKIDQPGQQKKASQLRWPGFRFAYPSGSWQLGSHGRCPGPNCDRSLGKAG